MADLTGERNMIDFMLSLENSQWRKWVDRLVLAAEGGAFGRDGRPASRYAGCICAGASGSLRLAAHPMVI